MTITDIDGKTLEIDPANIHTIGLHSSTDCPRHDGCGTLYVKTGEAVTHIHAADVVGLMKQLEQKAAGV